jgi:hypothetical protein
MTPWGCNNSFDIQDLFFCQDPLLLAMFEASSFRELVAFGLRQPKAPSQTD